MKQFESGMSETSPCLELRECGPAGYVYPIMEAVSACSDDLSIWEALWAGPKLDPISYKWPLISQLNLYSLHFFFSA